MIKNLDQVCFCPQYKIENAEFIKLLQDHKTWLKSGGRDGKRAELIGYDLSGLNLNCADLSRASFTHCNLDGCRFFNCKLDNCDLTYSILWSGLFRNCSLIGADIRGANLHCCVFHSDCNLTDAKINWPMQCPEVGSFIGWKVAHTPYPEVLKDKEHVYDVDIPVLVSLEIPEDAKRSSAVSRKCRCNKAKVLSITTFDGFDLSDHTAFSYHNHWFVYRVGEVVEVDNFDENRWNECSTGIHFFLTKNEAIEYVNGHF